MKINILSLSINSFDMSKKGNVQGDELLARFWVDSLKDHHQVERVALNSNKPKEFDVNISFTPQVRVKEGFNVLYLQNVFPKPAWPGTEAVFDQVKKNYDAYIFTSDKLRDKCADGLVLPFCTNKKIFSPKEYDSKFDYDICFVGNRIRDDETNKKFLFEIDSSHIGLFGNPDSWKTSLCQGKISIDDEAVLYSSSKSCLNMTIKEHIENGCISFRIYNILACKGFVITDYMEELEEFRDCVVFSTGGKDLEDKIKHYAEFKNETIPYREAGYKLVSEKHDSTHRVAELIKWLETKI